MRRACPIASTEPYPRRTAIPSAVGLAMPARLPKHTRRRLPILVGGTGLYFKALTEGLAQVPDIPAEIWSYWRERSEQLYATPCMPSLLRDPTMAARLGPADPQRIVRALQ